MVARNGVVAAGHPQTAQAARDVLRAGGNAFDAALAALCCACITEPVLASLGGGGFLLAATRDRGDRLYDFFVHTPRRKRPAAELDFYPVTVDFGGAQQEFHIGVGAVATPGMVRGMFQVHRELGHMPMREIVAPALALAREGAALNALQAYILGLVSPIYTATPSARALFTRDGDPRHLIGEGDPLRCPEWAELLEALAREGERLFYEGEVARRIVEQARSQGGHLSAVDLREYRVVTRDPLEVAFDEHLLLTNPPPSSGGILIGFALKLLEGTDLGAAPWGGVRHWSLLAEVMATTNKARVDALLAGDVEAGAPGMLDAGFLARYRAGVHQRAQALRGTTHISVMDAAGNTAALSVSNGEGCGTLVPGTGLMLNNMLGEEDLNPSGFHAWTCDARMTSMMAPSVVRTRGSDRVIALGSGGSNRIRTALLQVLVNLLVFGLPVEQAVVRHRIHCERDFLNLEAGDPRALADLLADWPRHCIWDARNMFFGGTHCVLGANRRFEGAGDPRRGGVSLLA